MSTLWECALVESVCACVCHKEEPFKERSRRALKGKVDHKGTQQFPYVLGTEGQRGLGLLHTAMERPLGFQEQLNRKHPSALQNCGRL